METLRDFAAVTGAGLCVLALFFLLMSAFAMAIGGPSEWRVMWRDTLGGWLAAVGLAVIFGLLHAGFAPTDAQKAAQREARTIGVKIGEHPDGSEVWKVADGSNWSVYLKPKGKQ
jgi:hypothetical protein